MNRKVEQVVIISGTNARELAGAVKFLTNTKGSIKQFDHNFFGSTYCVWNDKVPICSVSRVFRSGEGEIEKYVCGAFVEPTDAYRIEFYRDTDQINVGDLTKTIEGMRERSIAVRLRTAATDVRELWNRIAIRLPV